MESTQKTLSIFKENLKNSINDLFSNIIYLSGDYIVENPDFGMTKETTVWSCEINTDLDYLEHIEMINKIKKTMELNDMPFMYVIGSHRTRLIISIKTYFIL